MPQFIEVSTPAGGIAILTLKRPEKKNALSIALRDEVTEALQTLVEDKALKVLVLTGAGNVFSAGFDLKEFQQLSDEAGQKRLWDSSDAFHKAVLEFPLPTVAAVNGPALAGGFDLAMLCDLRIASENARFAHPEMVFGDVVFGPLEAAVGGAIARDLAFTGREVSAEEALRLGLVSRVVPREALTAEVQKVAGQIARAPRDILRRTKAKALARAGIEVGKTLDL